MGKHFPSIPWTAMFTHCIEGIDAMISWFCLPPPETAIYSPTPFTHTRWRGFPIFNAESAHAKPANGFSLDQALGTYTPNGLLQTFLS